MGANSVDSSILRELLKYVYLAERRHDLQLIELMELVKVADFLGIASVEDGLIIEGVKQLKRDNEMVSFGKNSKVTSSRPNFKFSSFSSYLQQVVSHQIDNVLPNQ